MVRFLLQAAGYLPGGLTLCDAVREWPSFTRKKNSADSDRLTEAVQLLVEAGWARNAGGGEQLLEAAVKGHQPWSLIRALQQRARARGTVQVVSNAAAVGCEAALEALVRMDANEEFKGGVGMSWYAAAANNGDRGTLACLRRLAVRLGEGLLEAAKGQGAPPPAVRWLVEQGCP